MSNERIESIFYELDTNHDQKVTKNEFLRTCLEIEDLIKAKTAQTIYSLNEFRAKYEEVTRKLAEAKVPDIYQKKVTEKINEYGIMDGSILTVNVIEAKDLIPQDINGTSDPYAIIGIEGQRQSTKYIRNTTNPIWNETLTL